MKLSDLLALSLAFIASPFAQASSVLVNPPEPYIQHRLGDSAYSIYYAASTTGNPVNGAAHIDNTRGYRFINIYGTDNPNLVWVDVSTDQTFTPAAGQVVFVSLATSTTSGNEISLTGAGVVTTNIAPPICNANGTTTCPGVSGGRSNLSAVYTPGSVLRLSFSIADLCKAPGVAITTGSICTTGQVPFALIGNTLSTQIVANFSTGVMPTGTPSTATSNASLTFTLTLSDIAPTLSCPTSGNIEDYYFPGDSEIFFNSINFPSTVGSNASTLATGVPLQNVVLLANRGAVPDITANTMPAVELVRYVGPTSNREIVSGFQNIAESEPGYSAAAYAENAAGILSDPAQSCRTFPEPIKPRPVVGILNESKCFIATAAYHDGRAKPVMMLREFRDQVLAKFNLGQNLINTYYEYSPALAEWAWDKPWVRSLALRVLAPVELVAWSILKISQAEQTSTQPYIDRIKKKIDEKDPPPPSGGESYIDQLKREIGPSPTPSESYIDQLKKKIPEATPTQGFTEEEKKKLGPATERESPIKVVQEGRDQYPVPIRPNIKSAVSFKFGISPGVKVINPSNSNVTFEQIYGSGFQPDLMLHYERQWLHSENFGSLALSVDLGVSYAEGFGQLAYGFGSDNSSQSITKLQFVQLPLLIGAYYRFNLLRLVRPYIGAGVGSMFYAEMRNDSQTGKRGYTPIYSGSLGASLLLNFFDRATSTDAYLSSGIQQTYFFLEYMRLNSFSKTGPSFERNGIYAGFLFEF